MAAAAQMLLMIGSSSFVNRGQMETTKVVNSTKISTNIPSSFSTNTRRRRLLLVRGSDPQREAEDSSTENGFTSQEDLNYLWQLVVGSIGGAAVIKYGSILFPNITRPNIAEALIMISTPVIVAVLLLIKQSSVTIQFRWGRACSSNEDIVLFIAGLKFINSFYLPPKKFMAWFGSLFQDNSSVISTPTAMVSKDTGHEKAELEKVFATFDKNGDGFITKQELGESLKNIGIFSSEKEVVGMVERLDSNGDGLIDMDEFSEMYGSMGSGGEEASRKDGEEEEEEDGEGELKEAFDVFDGNGDGLITVEELSLVLSSLGLKKGMRMEDCKEMIQKVDLDGDGMVNFEEFKRMMKPGGRTFVVS
ncbi:hypothetical protein HHK36_013912 [Tetracentron sinense]|uniref:EF-hand domain-containing protein n=1 Tax=Tetracentron sinense TaxID=13715 RepID=A0A834Z8Y7_TETSI|nr:hypothetical protein HHK36_013912 [Tetracentron sinense]